MFICLQIYLIIIIVMNFAELVLTVCYYTPSVY